MNSDYSLHHFSTIDDQPMQTTAVISYTSGLAPQPRPSLQGNNSVVLTMFMITIVAIVLVMRHSARYFKSAIQSIVTVRQRENAFDERTINEDAIVVILNIAVALSSAILLYSLYVPADIAYRVTSEIFLKLLALTGGFILMQYIAYSIIGYAFTTPNLSGQWISGFSAVQSFLGLSMMFPAAAALFYPGASGTLATLAAIMYIIGRICFICKGFRIFFNNIFSLLYFILYLCGAEIIPILLVYRKAVELCC